MHQHPNATPRSLRTPGLFTLLIAVFGFAHPAGAQCVIGGSNTAAQFDDEWGTAVAISADGTTAIVGGPGFNHSPGNGGGGAVRILVKAGSDWQQQAMIDSFNLPFPVANNGAFGTSVDISADGNTAIVGAPSDYNTLRVGSARILVRNPATGIWTQQARLFDPTPVNDGRFGYSVSISDDGNSVIVGQPGYSFSGISPGAYVFTRSGTTWSAATSLPASPAPGTNDEYGFSVAMSSNGLVAAVGAPGRVNGAMSHGATYVFRKVSGSWTLDEFITRTVAYLGYFDEVERFGHALSLYAAGGAETLAISDPENSELLVATGYDCPGTPPGICRVTRAGCVYLYTGSGGSWTMDTRVVAPEAQYPIDPDLLDDNDAFGSSVAIRGSHLVVGAWRDEDCENGGFFSNNGSVYRFEGASMQQHVLHPVHFTNDNFGASVDITDDGHTFIAGAPGGDEATVDFTGTAEVFDGTTSTQLIGVDPATSAFDVTITFPGGDPRPQTFTVHLTGRLYAIVGLDCNGDPASMGVQDYDGLSTVEQNFTIALPGGQSATFGQVNLATLGSGHAASLDSSGTGYMRGYSIGGSTELLSPIPFVGEPSCPYGCVLSAINNACLCSPMEALFDWCLSVFITDPDDGAGANLTIRDLDATSTLDLGFGPNNPVIHITGGINVPLPCAADITGDETVNVADLLAVITNWGACNDCQDCPADIAPAKPDCNVNVTDLLAVITNWGACP